MLTFISEHIRAIIKFQDSCELREELTCFEVAEKGKEAVMLQRPHSFSPATLEKMPPQANGQEGHCGPQEGEGSTRTRHHHPPGAVEGIMFRLGDERQPREKPCSLKLQ